jgi:2-dehydropantoate 2-reductase
MRIVVLGAGGLGSIVGGLLAQAGHRVTMIGRQEYMAAINERGLAIEGASGTSYSRGVQAMTDFEPRDDVDLLILTVKTYDTDDALRSIEDWRDLIKTAMSLQNGVQKDEKLTQFFGMDRVVGGTTMEGGKMLGPGRVLHTMSAVTYVGELDGRESRRIAQIAQAFNDAGMTTVVASDIRAVTWTKLNLGMPSHAVACLTGAMFHQTMANPHFASVLVDVSRECSSLGLKKGLTLRPVPGMELVHQIATLSREKGIDAVVRKGRELEADGVVNVRSGMYLDLLRRRTTEADDQFGYVLDEAERHGMHLPLTSMAYRLIKGLESQPFVAEARDRAQRSR